jgi:hypothetical protein
VNHADAVLNGGIGIFDVHGPAVYAYAAARRPVEPVQYVHEGGFAGTVFTQQGMDLTSVNRDIDPVIGRKIAEFFHDIDHLNGFTGKINKIQTRPPGKHPWARGTPLPTAV